jgi:hypothetical protein
VVRVQSIAARGWAMHATAALQGGGGGPQRHRVACPRSTVRSSQDSKKAVGGSHHTPALSHGAGCGNAGGLPGETLGRLDANQGLAHGPYARNTISNSAPPSGRSCSAIRSIRKAALATLAASFPRHLTLSTSQKMPSDEDTCALVRMERGYVGLALREVAQPHALLRPLLDAAPSCNLHLHDHVLHGGVEHNTGW